MNDHVDFERLVAGHIADEGVTPPSEAFYDELLARAAHKGPRPEWLALIKEPPMRTNSHLAVGSPTVRVAALLAATILLSTALAGAGVGVQRLLAADTSIIVAQDGSGDHTTITAGVAAAAPGDEVLVRPGTYVESVLVDKDITLRGDGDPTEIVLQVPEDGPRIDWPGFQLTHGLHLSGADAVVRDLTITTPSASTSGIVVRGGSPLITGMIVDVGSSPQTSARGFVFAGGGATPTIEDNITDGFIWIDEGADATIRGNRMLDDGDNELGVRVDGEGSHATVVDNELSESAVWDGASAEFSDVRFAASDSCMLNLRSSGPVSIADSHFEGASSLICSSDVLGLHVSGSTFDGAEMVALMVSGGDGRITDNTISGNGIGLGLTDSAISVDGNRIQENRVGVTLLGPANPAAFEGNTVCDNETDIVVNDGGVLPNADSNEICLLPL